MQNTYTAYINSEGLSLIQALRHAHHKKFYVDVYHTEFYNIITSINMNNIKGVDSLSTYMHLHCSEIIE